jgi:hypothetical protein
MDGELRTAISRGRGLEAGRFSCRTALPTDLVAVGPLGPLVGLTLAMVAERDPQRCDYAITLGWNRASCHRRRDHHRFGFGFPHPVRDLTAATLPLLAATHHA